MAIEVGMVAAEASSDKAGRVRHEARLRWRQLARLWGEVANTGRYALTRPNKISPTPCRRRSLARVAASRLSNASRPPPTPLQFCPVARRCPAPAVSTPSATLDSGFRGE
ncbi:hypothetical protein ZWY2020_032965 [Hordeum vulgare]|nr:hypothetical protein ZWY2020_032965 [Hordeum vulgare]